MASLPPTKKNWVVQQTLVEKRCLTSLNRFSAKFRRKIKLKLIFSYWNWENSLLSIDFLRKSWQQTEKKTLCTSLAKLFEWHSCEMFQQLAWSSSLTLVPVKLPLEVLIFWKRSCCSSILYSGKMSLSGNLVPKSSVAIIL